MWVAPVLREECQGRREVMGFFRTGEFRRDNSVLVLFTQSRSQGKRTYYSNVRTLIDKTGALVFVS